MGRDGRGAVDLKRYTAFTRDPDAGNPAGVVVDATALSEADMLAIAAEVGFSETAFLTRTGVRAYDVRYFSPQAEVPFCGHATVASGVALADLDDACRRTELTFATAAGLVTVRTDVDTDGYVTAELTSVPTSHADVSDADLSTALAALGWTTDELDDEIPPVVTYAGAHHLVLAAGTRERLATLDYHFERLLALMREQDWTTLQLVCRESAYTYHARDPFPVGGVVEDPATGAAAAAFGGYLRDSGRIDAPATITIHQGVDMGRPSRLTVHIPAGKGSGVRVSGNAVRML